MARAPPVCICDGRNSHFLSSSDYCSLYSICEGVGKTPLVSDWTDQNSYCLCVWWPSDGQNFYCLYLWLPEPQLFVSVIARTPTVRICDGQSSTRLYLWWPKLPFSEQFWLLLLVFAKVLAKLPWSVIGPTELLLSVFCCHEQPIVCTFVVVNSYCLCCNVMSSYCLYLCCHELLFSITDAVMNSFCLNLRC
jgi:hypothetical protein